MSKTKNQLVCSAPSLEKLAVMIGQYWYYSEPCVLKPNEDGKTWNVYYPPSCKSSGQQAVKYIVRLEKNRYRFEIKKTGNE